MKSSPKQDKRSKGVKVKPPKREFITSEGWVAGVYCDYCQHIFFDSFNAVMGANAKKEVGFLCPFCKRKLWVR